jgi:5'-3' exonuclease
MKTKAGVPTGLGFWFLRSPLSYEKQFNARDIVIAWDTPGAIKKAEGTQEYKANRVQILRKLRKPVA